jgi:hypothetical protein
MLSSRKKNSFGVIVATLILPGRAYLLSIDGEEDNGHEGTDIRIST